jgi:hypothetical protein
MGGLVATLLAIDELAQVLLAGVDLLPTTPVSDIRFFFTLSHVLPCRVLHSTVSPCLYSWATFLSLHDFLNANDLRWI